MSRPLLSSERLALTESGQVRLRLKTPYRDGMTHMIFEPENFIARLASLVPKPRAHLIRYDGVFAPNSALRDRVVTKPKAPARSEPDKKAEAPGIRFFCNGVDVLPTY